MDQQNKSMTRIFVGGLPTAPDVRKLREVFPVDLVRERGVVSYEDVEDVVRAKRRSFRFQSVTTSWRRAVEREDGVIIGVEKGVGFKILNEDEKVDLSGSKLESARRFARRSAVVAGQVDVRGVSEENRQRLLGIQNRSASILLAAKVKSGKAALPSMTG